MSTNLWKILLPQKVLAKRIDNALNTCDSKYVLAIKFLGASLSHMAIKKCKTLFVPTNRLCIGCYDYGEDQQRKLICFY